VSAPASSDATGAADFVGRAEQLAPTYAAAGRVLAWSFRVGAGLLVTGLLLAIFRGEPLGHELDPLGEIVPSLLAGRAAGVVDLAILWLMASPVFAVVAVAAGFLRLGDRRYALLSLLVLAVLAASILLALVR
jgi:uncharacterized membrane protein